MQPGMAWYSFMCSFIHSLAHSFILVHSFIHWFIHAIICSIIGSIVHSFICSFIHLFFHSFFPTTGLKHHIVYQELKTNPQHLSIINFLHFHNKALHVLMIAMLIIGCAHRQSWPQMLYLPQFILQQSRDQVPPGLFIEEETAPSVRLLSRR